MGERVLKALKQRVARRREVSLQDRGLLFAELRTDDITVKRRGVSSSQRLQQRAQMVTQLLPQLRHHGEVPRRAAVGASNHLNVACPDSANGADSLKILEDGPAQL